MGEPGVVMNHQLQFGESPEAEKAETSDKRVVAVLRRMIMDGSLEPGARISEVRVSEMFEVSRTPARLALSALEVEGLIRKREGRGYTVQEFNLGELSKAYEVRGVLEGLAAATLARTGPDAETLDRLNALTAEMDAILTAAGPFERRVGSYQDANIAFHETIMCKCGNEFVGFTFARLEGLPLVKLGTVAFNKAKPEDELLRLRFGNMQHRLIVDAIRRRDTLRADTLMREHANQILIYSGLLG